VRTGTASKAHVLVSPAGVKRSRIPPSTCIRCAERGAATKHVLPGGEVAALDRSAEVQLRSLPSP
jgi:hypothetical protein